MADEKKPDDKPGNQDTHPSTAATISTEGRHETWPKGQGEKTQTTPEGDKMFRGDNMGL